MDKQSSWRDRKVRDLPQRTLSGMIVHILWRLVCVALIVALTVATIGGVAAKLLYDRAMRYIEEDVKPNAGYSLEGQRLNQTSFIYAYNKKTGEYEQLRQLYALENRVWADYEEIPQQMIEATVAIEDKRFFEHDGVDWMRTVSASANMFLGSGTYGGSTLTQQLIKNLTQEKDVTVRRKLLEIFRALEFEKHYSKEEILEWYLNTIYLGEGAYGVKSAAQVYFGKELDELTVKECACIIGITNNPSRYDPYIYPENNEQRTLTILQQMYLQEMLSRREYDEACDQVLEFRNQNDSLQKFTCSNCGYKAAINHFEKIGDDYFCPNCGDKQIFDTKNDYYTYFEDAVITDVINDLMEQTGYTKELCSQMITTGGFIIYSTIDLDAQAKVDAVYQELANVPETHSAQQLQSAIIVIDNDSGDIVAMAGGVGEKPGNLTWNRATMSRLSPGSSIKPLTVYGPALAEGIITPGSAYEDSAYMELEGKQWPQNENRTYSGWMLVNNGLAQSLNTIAVKVLADLTPIKSYQFAKEKLGLTSLVQSEQINGTAFSDIDLAPLGMGQLTHGLTIREMASAYATFPNQGVYRKARTYTKVVDTDGNVILDNTQKTNVAMNSHAAWYMVQMLRYAVQYGTGTPAQIPDVPVAGKTGTTSDNRDRWFSGFTPNYTATVWCGYDDPEEVRPVINRNPAVMMWRQVMTLLQQDVPAKEYLQPDDEKYVSVNVCSQTGLLAGKHCEARTVKLFISDIPEKTCDLHRTFEIKLCYPEKENEDKHYCATDYCTLYNKLINSVEYHVLIEAGYTELKEFAGNIVEDSEISILKLETDEKEPTLKDALKENELIECPVHTAKRLAALQDAIEEAYKDYMEKQNPPDPPPGDEDPDEPPGPGDPDEP